MGNYFCLETGGVKPSTEHLDGAPSYRLSEGLKTSLANTSGFFFPWEVFLQLELSFNLKTCCLAHQMFQ